jgi:hypothetical protein
MTYDHHLHHLGSAGAVLTGTADTPVVAALSGGGRIHHEARGELDGFDYFIGRTERPTGVDDVGSPTFHTGGVLTSDDRRAFLPEPGEVIIHKHRAVGPSAHFTPSFEQIDGGLRDALVLKDEARAALFKGMDDDGTGFVISDKSKAEMASGKGTKDDFDKADYSLIPPFALRQLALLYTRGARKYSRFNWRNGMAWSRPYRAAIEHSLKWLGGEKLDPETGIHHMIAAAWNCFAIVEFEEFGIGEDNRWKAPK